MPGPKHREVSEYLSQFLGHTTVHGLVYLGRGNNLAAKAFWVEDFFLLYLAV